MRRARDSQKSKVYKAENKMPVRLFKNSHCNLCDVQAFIDKIVASRWWTARCNIRCVTVRDGRGSRKAGADGYNGWHEGYLCINALIRLPRWARSDLVVCHELAHLMTSGGVPAHGREFCQNYLALVRRWIGQEEAAMLREKFHEYGVKWHRRRNDG